MVPGRAKILLFGDSITQQSFSATHCGWGACLADHFQRKADVLNRGFSGYNSDWFLRFAKTDEGNVDLFGHNNVRLVTILLGANDACDPSLNKRLHVPLDDYKSNIRAIVSLVVSNFGNDVNILLISPPPVCEEKRLQFQKERYGVKATGKSEVSLELSGKYSKCLNDAASELGLPVLDIWGKMQYTSSGEKRQGWQQFLNDDGVHLSSSGNKFVGESLIELIDQICM